MKLKYYLRGLGIGIIVTAIIMSFTRQPEKLTDAQIKMRALELGMVEENVLADLEKEDTTYEESVAEEAVTPEEVIDEETTVEEPAVEEVTDEETTIEEAAEEVTTEEFVAEVESVTEEVAMEESVAVEEEIDENVVSEEVVESFVVISVASGNGSEVVSRKLYEAGLVDSEVGYNQFLVKNGYDRKLRVGNHEIPVGATEEEMAKILCGMK